MEIVHAQCVQSTLSKSTWHVKVYSSPRTVPFIRTEVLSKCFMKQNYIPFNIEQYFPNSVIRRKWVITRQLTETQNETHNGEKNECLDVEQKILVTKTLYTYFCRLKV